MTITTNPQADLDQVRVETLRKVVAMLRRQAAASDDKDGFNAGIEWSADFIEEFVDRAPAAPRA